MPEVKLGMIPAAGGTQTLPRHSSLSLAVELLLTGRTISAVEALNMKLLTRVVPEHELTKTSLNICHELSLVPTKVLSATKLALRESNNLTLREALSLGSRLSLRTLISYDGN